MFIGDFLYDNGNMFNYTGIIFATKINITEGFPFTIYNGVLFLPLQALPRITKVTYNFIVKDKVLSPKCILKWKQRIFITDDASFYTGFPKSSSKESFLNKGRDKRYSRHIAGSSLL